jgi:hypothetical protein
LNFNNLGAEEQKRQRQQKSDEPQTMSLMGGIARPEGLPDADDFEFIDEAKGDSKLLSHGTLVVLMVFVVAAGALYLMRLSNNGITTQANAEVESRIDTWLAKVANPNAMAPEDPLKKENLDELLGTTDEVLETFNFEMHKNQVPIEYVQKNPFEMPKVEEATQQVDTTDRERQLMLQKLDREFKTLKLQSIMLGQRKIAVINGELKQVGQAVGSFRIEAIDGRQVVLSAMGEKFILTQAEDIRTR